MENSKNKTMNRNSMKIRIKNFIGDLFNDLFFKGYWIFLIAFLIVGIIYTNNYFFNIIMISWVWYLVAKYENELNKANNLKKEISRLIEYEKKGGIEWLKTQIDWLKNHSI